MIRLLFLVVLAVIKAESTENGFKPTMKYLAPEMAETAMKAWSEDAYLSYIRNMAMFPKVTPISRQDFEKSAVSRDGKAMYAYGPPINGNFDSLFDQKFNNFGSTQQPEKAGNDKRILNNFFGNQQTGQSGGALLQNGNFGQSLNHFGGLQSGAIAGNFAPNANFATFPPNSNFGQNFAGGLLPPNGAIFGGVLPPINVETIQPEKFQSAVNAFMNVPGTNPTLMMQQLQQSGMNQFMYPTTSYGTPIPGSYPQPPPPTPAQQQEVMKMMKMLLSNVQGQETQSTEIQPQYEFKLSIPKVVKADPRPEASFTNAELGDYWTRGRDTVGAQSSNDNANFKQFDFGPGAKIINPSDYEQQGFGFHDFQNPKKSPKQVQHYNFQNQEVGFQGQKFNSKGIHNQGFSFDEPPKSGKLNFDPFAPKQQHFDDFQNRNPSNGFQNHYNPKGFQKNNHYHPQDLPVREPDQFHHHRYAPGRFENGFKYPSLTQEGFRNGPKRNAGNNFRNGKSLKPHRKPKRSQGRKTVPQSYSLKIFKT